MTRWLLALYPRQFRARYGEEVCDLLARSEHHHRDIVDIAIHGVALRWEDIMTRSLRHVANISVAAALIAFGYVVNDLQHGVTEVPRHWWSAGALGLGIITIAARTAIGVVDERRRQPHTD